MGSIAKRNGIFCNFIVFSVLRPSNSTARGARVQKGEIPMMKVIQLSGMFAAAVAAVLTLASPASAQATRTWISGVGDDVNPCSRTAPCKTFPGAISKTAAGGEIDTLDPGGFGAVTVTKSITLANEGIGEAGILVAGTNGVTVNCATDPNCTVVLRGLQIDGGPIGSNSLSGVRFVAGRALIIQNCVIRNFTGGSPNGYGVLFNPSASQPEYLYIEDTTLQNNGPVGGTGGNVFVQPSGSPSVYVSIHNTSALNGGFGFAADSSNMTPGTGVGIFMSVADSTAAGNANGGAAATNTASGAVANINLNHDVINGNGVGMNAKGASTTIRFGNSTITNNTIEYKNTGTMTTYGTNNRSDNGPGTGTAPTTVGPT